MRTGICALALLSACTFAEEKVRVTVAVANVPPDAGYLDVTVTDSLSFSKTYHPITVGLDGGVLPLAFAAPTQSGRVDVKIVAPDGFETTASGVYADPTPLDLSARIGFATSCAVKGCAPTLGCATYGPGDKGVCTHSCSNPGQCESTLPAASCDAGLCQWNCSDGGVCPPGLTCVTSGPAKFCSGL
jgi:hypothetical protein